MRRESALAASLVHDITGEVPEPETYRKAVAANHPEREEWLNSMNRESDTLQERCTWIMVPRSSIGKHKPVRCKYVYRKKILKDGSLQFKSRLVACGYSQVAGLDYSRRNLRWRVFIFINTFFYVVSFSISRSQEARSNAGTRTELTADMCSQRMQR